MGESGIRELRQHASRVVARAAGGEIVTITDRNRPVALLTPIPAGRLERLLAAGMARAATTDLADLPPALPADGPSLSVALARMRDDDRF